MPTTQNATGSHYVPCDTHDGCEMSVSYHVDDKGRNVVHRDHRNATGSHYTSETVILPDHIVIYDGGDPLDRFVLRCACGYESAYFSYIAAARSMDLHLGDTFVPVQQRKVTAEQVSA